MPTFFLEFETRKSEAPTEAVFLAKGGSLGAAAARAETDFALTHSATATTRLVTDAAQTVRLPIPQELLDATVGVRARVAPTALAGPTVVLPARARLNATSSKLACSINGTLVGSLAGQASVPLAQLFAHAHAPLDRVAGVAEVTGVADGADAVFGELNSVTS